MSPRAIVEAAARRNIPWRRLNGASLVQLGYGRGRKLIQAAMTGGTSAIGVDIAEGARKGIARGGRTAGAARSGCRNARGGGRRLVAPRRACRVEAARVGVAVNPTTYLAFTCFMTCSKVNAEM